MRTPMILLIFAAACVHGQTAGRGMTANVPFAFEAHGVKMAAGEYIATKTATSSMRWRWRTPMPGSERSSPPPDKLNC